VPGGFLRWNPQEAADRQTQTMVFSMAAVTPDSAIQGRDFPNLKQLSLSNPHAPSPAAPTLSYEFSVNTNVTVHQFHAWGFYWDPKAWFAAGGPRRP